MKKTTCVVPGCDSIDTQNNSIKFYQIPKEPEVRKKWLKAINRTEAEINKKSKVCSKHFKTQDYAITRFNYYMGGKSIPSSSKNTCEFKALKTEAVPNQQLPQKSTFKIKISKKDNSKQIKVEEVKVKEEKIDKEKEKEKEKPEKVRMPKRPAPPDSPPRSRTQSRRAASKEALKQMQLLLDDENDAVEIPDEDIYKTQVIPVDPSPSHPPPPKKKYKLSHRKSSDGNDREVLVLKTITNRDAENTLQLDCWVEQLEQVQRDRMKIIQNEEKEIQAKLDSLVSQSNGKVIHKGDLHTIIEVTEQVQSAIQGAQAPPTSLIINNNLGGQQSYQLIMDPRIGLVVGAVNPPPTPPPPPKPVQGRVQVAQNLQQTPPTPNQNTPRVATRTRARVSTNKLTPPPAPSPPMAPPTRSKSTSSQGLPQISTPPLTRGQGTHSRTQTPASTPPTRAQAPTTTPQTRGQAQMTPQTRGQMQSNTAQTRGQVQAATPQTRGQVQSATAQTRAQVQTATPQTRGQVQTATPQTRAQVQTTPQTRAQATPSQTRTQATPPQTRGKAAAVPASKKPVTVVTRGRGPTPNTFTTSVRPSETNVEGGLTTGSAQAGKKVVVDLTSDDSSKSAPDSREIAFNKLQGKTYPSLVVVARPHLRVEDLSLDRPKLDAKVKSVLMHAPTKFTEWLIQQGLIRSEQKCSVHTGTQLKLGMYSDVSKFPYSGGYVWISECCPQRFVSVFSGSLFEGSPHPPMVILKLLYHWACQTNIQNVTQWVKVDNLYVKGMFTWLRSICTVALQTHIRQIGGPGIKVEVGVISLGTTSQDGNQRQVKVEVLGVLESESKLIRLRAVEPQTEGDRNYKKRFSKILEPLIQWVHPQSILVADLTVDKQTLIGMGFTNVVHYSSTQYGNNNQIMDYLRRIVPRMFQNTLSLLSRQIIQQFLDELVWREWFGTSSLQAFDNLVLHLAEQTRFDSGMSLIVRLNKVAQNPFKSWNMNLGNPTKVVENSKKSRNARKPEPPKVPQAAPADVNRPPKSTSPDVPEQMVPLESYYYGTIDTYSKTPKITLNMKCPFCKSVFDNNIHLMNHLFKHAHNVSMDAQLCRYCLTSVATANDLLKHIATSHPAETKFDNGFCCLICETQYMNPFVLGKHMSKEHCPSELPYQCGTCGYRCSNHKQAIDHFYRTHDNGPTIQCPFCLKSTTVFTSSRNIVQNMNYFIQHLQKHQRKQFARRCGKCNLWFVQKDVLKDHQNKMHVSQRGKSGLVSWTAPRNGVMVPKSKMDKYPGDAEVINFAALNFNLEKGLMCKECNTAMDTTKHFPSFESCQNPNCQYSTCCTNAMQEHNAKCSKTNNPIAEEKLPFEMYCICGFSHTDGNQMARHLAICERKSAYPSRSDAKSAIVTHSMLDVLGLVRKPEENPKTENSKPKPKTEKKKRLKKEDSIEKVEENIGLDVDATITNTDHVKEEEDTKIKNTGKETDNATKPPKEEKEKVKKRNNKNKDNTDKAEITIQKQTESIPKVSSRTKQKLDKKIESKQSPVEENEDVEMPLVQLENKKEDKPEPEESEKSTEVEDNKSEIEENKITEAENEKNTVEDERSEIEEVSENKENNDIQSTDSTEVKDNDIDTVSNKDENVKADTENLPEDLMENKDDISQEDTVQSTSEDNVNIDNGDREDTSDSCKDFDKGDNSHIDDENITEDNSHIDDKECTNDSFQNIDTNTSQTEDNFQNDNSQDINEDNQTDAQNQFQVSDKEDTTDSYGDLNQKDITNATDSISDDKDSSSQSHNTQNINKDKDIFEDNNIEDTNDSEENINKTTDDFQDTNDSYRDVEKGDINEGSRDIFQEDDKKDTDYFNDQAEDIESKSEENQETEAIERKSPDENEAEELDETFEKKETANVLDILEESSEKVVEELGNYIEKSPSRDLEIPNEFLQDPSESETREPSEDLKEIEEPSEKQLDFGDVEKHTTENYNSDIQSHTLENMETSEISQDKEPTITSDDIQNLLSDVVGESDLSSVMDTDTKQSEGDDMMASPTEMMDIPDCSGDVPTPMETD